MKKNFTVNISGIIFHIDEDAYDKLNGYLSSIRHHFEGEDSRDEICQDIEARIAEMLQDRLSEGKKVITIEDVADVIAEMGQPFEISEEDPKAEGREQGRRGPKRLYRDSENKILGGVCTGMGAYFRTDPLWFRLAFVVSFFFAGPFLYILFWLVIPAARTTAEKLEMKGEAVNVSSIERSIREELSDLAEKVKDIGKEGSKGFKKKLNEEPTGFERLVDGSIILARYFIKAFVILLGISLIIISIGIAIPFVASFFEGTGSAITWGEASWLSLPGFFDLLFDDPRDKMMALAGIGFMVGIPLMMLLYHGIKLLFGIRYHSRAIGASALGLWIVGLILTSVAGISLAADFRNEAHTTHSEEIRPDGAGTIFLTALPDRFDSEYVCEDLRYHPDEGEGVFSIIPEFDIVRSRDGMTRLVSYSSARGRSLADARENATFISYPLLIEDSLVSLPVSYLLDAGARWRDQELRVVMEVPEGTRIQATHDIEVLTRASDNWFRFPSDFGGRTWVMSRDEGLVAATD